MSGTVAFLLLLFSSGYFHFSAAFWGDFSTC